MSVQLGIITQGINHTFTTKFSTVRDTLQIMWSNVHPPIYVAMAILSLVWKKDIIKT